MKKILATLLSAAMLCTLCSTAFAAEEQNTDGTFDGYQEIVQSSFSQKSVAPAALSNANNKVIIHNKGNLMTSDYFVEGKSDGNSLVARNLHSCRWKDRRNCSFYLWEFHE